MKRYIYILLATLCIATPALTQTSLGLYVGGRIKRLNPTNQALNEGIMLGAPVKKFVSPNLNLVSGLLIRMFDYDVHTLPTNNDLVTHFKDVYPQEFFYIVDGEYFRMTYLTVPLGIELKLTTYLRLQYCFEPNLKLGANDAVQEYLQYGTKSVASYNFSNSVSLLLHGGTAVGLAIGLTRMPSPLRGDLNYTYDFMHEFDKAMHNSYLITFALWGDFSFKPRKKL